MMESSICKSWKMTEGTIKAVPIPTVPESSILSLRPGRLNRGWKALLPEMKNNYAVYIYIRIQV